MRLVKDIVLASYFGTPSLAAIQSRPFREEASSLPGMCGRLFQKLRTLL